VVSKLLPFTQERDWTVHPGEVLLETLEFAHMSQAEFARRTDLSTKHVNQIIKGKSGYTAETALRFELVLGIPAEFWLRLLANHRTDLARGIKPLSRAAGESHGKSDTPRGSP
jgi:addiction module HigA family antidote